MISTVYFSLTGNETPQIVASMESSGNEIETIAVVARTGHSLVLSCICGHGARARRFGSNKNLGKFHDMQLAPPK